MVGAMHAGAIRIGGRAACTASAASATGSVGCSRVGVTRETGISPTTTATASAAAGFLRTAVNIRSASRSSARAASTWA